MHNCLVSTSIKAAFLLLLICAALACRPQSAPLKDAISGDWLVTREMFGNPAYFRMKLKLADGKVTGEVAGDKVEGTLTGNALHLVSRDEDNNTSEFNGTLDRGEIRGTLVETDAGDPSHKRESQFTAVRPPSPRPGPPQRHEFTPTTFYRQFSAANKPVLEIAPGDTVHTTTVDAGGADEHGVRRVLGGNPETGPFYVQTAWPGDTLVVHFTRIRLNRDYAMSDDAIVDRALDSSMSVKMKDAGKDVKWHLDRERMVATSERPGDHLQNFTVPIRPMLGCVATAPGFGSAPPPTGDSGRWGGNMDFNEIVEGVTVYLPVNQPGALLYVGDGHAAQGDGELNGNALETSMEVEFTVNLIHDKRIRTPRVESDRQIMTVGLGGSLEDALRAATSGMSQWLEQDYGLTPSEIAQVLGTSAQFSISEVADRNAGVAAKLSKERLQSLARKQ
jgi:acetamidase/formamidase